MHQYAHSYRPVNPPKYAIQHEYGHALDPRHNPSSIQQRSSGMRIDISPTDGIKLDTEKFEDKNPYLTTLIVMFTLVIVAAAWISYLYFSSKK